jgi:GrpB-like predicted nucleotidyltransferase (UPF0157 family)
MSMASAGEAPRTMPGDAGTSGLPDASAPQQEPTSEERLRKVTIGELRPFAGRIEIVDYDPSWPRLFEQAAKTISEALASRLLLIEHVGSTSVPGLAAKPRLDLLMVVADPVDEAAYVPALEAIGYALRIREEDWYQHRLLQGTDPAMNLHVFAPDCPEVGRMLRFRDWLRSNESDRSLYEQTKRELATKEWKYGQNYADAKSAVVEGILARASGKI